MGLAHRGPQVAGCVVVSVNYDSWTRAVGAKLAPKLQSILLTYFGDGVEHASGETLTLMVCKHTASFRKSGADPYIEPKTMTVRSGELTSYDAVYQNVVCQHVVWLLILKTRFCEKSVMTIDDETSRSVTCGYRGPTVGEHIVKFFVC